MKRTICKNCDFEFEGRYCPECAQSIKANSRLTFKNIVSDFIDTVFNLDKGFFYTLWNLLKQPGFVAKSFIEGKRKQFTNPVKYLIIATAVQALFEYIFMDKDQGVAYMGFSFLSDGVNQNMHLWNQSFTLDYPILFGIINLLFWTIPLYFLFKNLKFNFPELIAVMMYFYGTIVILIELAVMIYTPIAKKNIPIELVGLIATIYMTYAMLNFYHKGIISWRIPRIVIAMVLIFAFRMFIFPFSMAWLFPLN